MIPRDSYCVPGTPYNTIWFLLNNMFFVCELFFVSVVDQLVLGVMFSEILNRCIPLERLKILEAYNMENYHNDQNPLLRFQNSCAPFNPSKKFILKMIQNHPICLKFFWRIWLKSSPCRVWCILLVNTNSPVSNV